MLLFLANGAMGIGLEQWDHPVWFTYVAVMTLFEAWFIGRWLQMSAAAAIGTSIIANLLTGVFCAVGGLFAPFLHGSWSGGRIDPDPLMHTVYTLTFFALPSALFEAFIWRGMSKWVQSEKSGASVAASFVAHVIGIPLGLIILLFPSHPYPNLEFRTERERTFMIEYEFRNALDLYISTNSKMPAAKTLDELVKEIGFDETRNPRALFYIPDYERFDTGERFRGKKWEFNSALAGRKINESYDGDPVWYLRSPDHRRGLYIDLAYGQLSSFRPPSP